MEPHPEMGEGHDVPVSREEWEPLDPVQRNCYRDSARTDYGNTALPSSGASTENRELISKQEILEVEPQMQPQEESQGKASLLSKCSDREEEMVGQQALRKPLIPET